MYLNVKMSIYQLVLTTDSRRFLYCDFYQLLMCGAYYWPYCYIVVNAVLLCLFLIIRPLIKI